MSIRRIIKKKIKKYSNSEKLLAPKSERKFNGIFLAWFILGYILGNLINTYGIMLSDCLICEVISAGVPSIHKMAAGSYYKETMHYVWLYFIVTSPLVLILFFIFVKNFNRRLLPNWGIIIFIIIELVGIYVCFLGVEFGGVDALGRFGKLYYHSLLYSTLVAFAFSGMMIAPILFLMHHIIGTIKNESFAGGR